jgi:hypothetical protein
MRRRHSQARRKLQLEVLEPRQLLSHSIDPLRLVAASAIAHPSHTSAGAVPLNVAGAELDGLASALVHHPRHAERHGLGTLAEMLVRDKAYATRHGWGATLDLVLSQHPGYAARHHLTALIASPAASQPTTPQAGTTAQPAPSATSSTTPVSTPAMTTSDPTTPSGLAATQTLASSPPAQSVVTVAPQSFAVDVGGALDVTIQPGSVRGAGTTYTITPQPLPANMTFNRGSGELVLAPAPGTGRDVPVHHHDRE